MASKPDPRSLFGHLWGSFQTAVNDPLVRDQPGGVQQYVWQSVRNDYLSRGEPLPPGSFQGVNALLSLAGQQRRAAAQLGKAIDAYQLTGRETALTSEHMSPDIDTRPLSAQLTGPRLRIRFGAQMTLQGELIVQNFTWDPGLNVPQTVGGLLEGLDEAAAAAAEDYGFEWTGNATVLSVTTI